MSVNIQIAEVIKDAIIKYNIEKAYIMMYFYDKVVMGKVVDSKPLYAIKENGAPVLTEYCFDDELCYEIHIFNKEKELRWHRLEESTVDNMEFVLITDPKEDKILGEMFFEEKMFIIGSRGDRVIENGEDTTLLGQYGREVILPFKVAEKVDLRLAVHHIFDEDGSISGYRLVDIEGGDM